jgi:hypothetical protein
MRCLLLTQSGHSVLRIFVAQNDGSAPFHRSQIPAVIGLRSSVVPSLGQAMRRRDFIKAIAGSGAVWPLTLTTSAQQPKVPLIGFLGTTSQTAWRQPVAAFEKRLAELGWIPGRTRLSSSTVGPKAVTNSRQRSSRLSFSGKWT